MAVTAFLLYVLSTLVVIIIFYIYCHLTFWKRRGIPYTQPHLLTGNMTGYKTKILEQLIGEVYDQHKGSGPICGFYFLHRPKVMVLDIALAKKVLSKDFASFADRGAFNNERDDPLTGHLFNLDYVKWKVLRQILSPAFASGKLKYMFPTVISMADQLVEVFTEMIQQSGGGATIEIKEVMARFTTDVIGCCAFGIECNSLKDPEAEFRMKGRMLLKKRRHGMLVMGFIRSFPDLARALRMREIHDDVHNFFLGTIRETVAYREQHKVKRNDLMDLLIEIKNQESNDSEDIFCNLTVEQIAAQCFLFFVAGFESSSSTMGFTLYELARHPKWQEALRTEINEVLAKYEQKFNYECLKELQLMDQVISEIFRLYTVVPFVQRKCTQEYVVPGHPKYVIEKGMIVLIPSASYHHDPAYYPDPYEFKPERFAPEMVRQRDSIMWLPFGDGPRNCVAFRFGEMQICIALVHLLRNFRFSFCNETPHPLKFDPKYFPLTSKGGIVLRVERIS